MSLNNKLIVFDLDGTLLESSETIYQAAIKTLEHFGIEERFSKEEMDKRIGAHFADIFIELNIPVLDVEDYINVYKVYYFDFINLSIFYPNVVETIKHLKNAGAKIALLTTKAQDQAENILKHFNIDGNFDLIMGRRPGIEHKPSAQPLNMIIEKLGMTKENTFMVGDSEFDIRCGKNANIKTVAVTYGYRDIEFLKKEFPDYILSNISELAKLLTQSSKVNQNEIN